MSHDCETPICQLRLDLIDFELMSPVAGNCDSDQFIIRANEPLPILCGKTRCYYSKTFLGGWNILERCSTLNDQIKRLRWRSLVKRAKRAYSAMLDQNKNKTSVQKMSPLQRKGSVLSKKLLHKNMTGKLIWYVSKVNVNDLKNCIFFWNFIT